MTVYLWDYEGRMTRLGILMTEVRVSLASVRTSLETVRVTVARSSICLADDLSTRDTQSK